VRWILIWTASGERLHVSFALLSSGAAARSVSFGGVESNLSANAAGLLVLPALSVQRPETEASPLSGPSYAGASHDAIPEVASEPVNER
jgi:hypothetical protein